MKLLNNKVFKIIKNIIKTLFFTLLTIYICFILIQRLTGNKSIFGYRLFTVATGSMSGVYEINDVIVVKDYNPKKLKIGDDIAYKGEKEGLKNKLITHRIIKIETKDNKTIYTTKGVNSDIEDPEITEEQILGKVVGIIPLITQINHIVKTQLGFFIIVFCPLVIIIMLEILQTITEIKLDKTEEKSNEKKKNKKETKDDDEII